MTDNLWKVLEHTNDWLRFADTKAAGALSGSGVLGGAMRDVNEVLTTVC